MSDTQTGAEQRGEQILAVFDTAFGQPPPPTPQRSV